MGAKQTSNLIPLCHNINIEKVSLDFTLEEDGILIKSYLRCSYKTGIEMEALTAVINHPVLKNLPCILETPNELPGYAKEIALLRSLRQ